MRAKAHKEGVGFAAVGSDDYAPGTLARSLESLRSLHGLAALRYSIKGSAQITDLFLRDGPEVLKAEKIDALLVDQNEPAGGTLAQRLQIPFLSVCTSLPLNREASIPPPFTAWPFSNSTFAKARNRLSNAIVDRLISPIQTVLNSYRRRWRLPSIAKPDDTFSSLGTLAQVPREFDFPRVELPEHFYYLGPWFDEQTSSHGRFPFEKLDGRPIVYGSLGTLQSPMHEAFRVMAEACSSLNVQLVLSLGTDAEIPRLNLPGNPLVVGYVPQTELLAKAAITITHGGMNTTLQSLHFGVPAVAIPLDHDQPAIAARLARTGAGVFIERGKLNPSTLRTALQDMLPSSSRFRLRARALQQEIANSGGIRQAADLAERLLISK
jgi:MGT family glycosyltransferase